MCVCDPSRPRETTDNVAAAFCGGGGGLGGCVGVFYCEKFPSPFLSLARFGQRCVGATERGRKQREADRERKTV